MIVDVDIQRINCFEAFVQFSGSTAGPAAPIVKFLDACVNLLGRRLVVIRCNLLLSNAVRFAMV